MERENRVETISRLAQWRIDTFGPSSYRRSDSFKIGIWNWYLSVEKARYVYVRLFPEPGRVAKERPPLARFLLRACWSGPPRRSCVSPGTYTPLLSSFFLPPPPYLALGYGPSPF
jgi:speckle-type POZ protein